MRSMIALTAAAMALAGALHAARASDGTDLEKLQGEWTFVSGEKAGQAPPGGELKMATVTFTGNEISCTGVPHEAKGTFSLDPTKSPREIELTMNGHAIKGIYRLEGDALTICLGEERPTEFATREGVNALLMTLKRKKP